MLCQLTKSHCDPTSTPCNTTGHSGLSPRPTNVYSGILPSTSIPAGITNSTSQEPQAGPSSAELPDHMDVGIPEADGTPERAEDGVATIPREIGTPGPDKAAVAVTIDVPEVQRTPKH